MDVAAGSETSVRSAVARYSWARDSAVQQTLDGDRQVSAAVGLSSDAGALDAAADLVLRRTASSADTGRVGAAPAHRVATACAPGRAAAGADVDHRYTDSPRQRTRW